MSKQVKKVVDGSTMTEEIRHMIAERAYFRAEQRGFLGGSAEQDWLEAEAEINELLHEHSQERALEPLQLHQAGTPKSRPQDEPQLQSAGRPARRAAAAR